MQSKLSQSGTKVMSLIAVPKTHKSTFIAHILTYYGATSMFRSHSYHILQKAYLTHCTACMDSQWFSSAHRHSGWIHRFIRLHARSM